MDSKVERPGSSLPSEKVAEVAGSNPALTAMSSGVFMAAWGKPGYGYAAYNLAFSIKYHSPQVHITLLTDGAATSYLRKEWLSVFDDIVYMSDELKSLRSDPGKLKTSLYDLLPYDYNIFLDVDALCLKDITPMIEALISAGGYYYTDIVGEHHLSQGNEIPHMMWAYAKDIWEHFELKEDAVLPSTNSSFQFIKKCEESKKLFGQIKSNFDNPIPLNKLRMQWGGTQPDELYLNIALCQLGINAKIGSFLFYGTRGTYTPCMEVQEKYYFLSIWGGRNFITPMYKEWYDKLLIRWHYDKKMNNVAKYQDVVRDKHANGKPKDINSATNIAPVTFSFPKGHEKINLLLSWYEATKEGRRKEIYSTLRKNAQSDIDKIIIVYENEFSPETLKLFEELGKIIPVKVDARPTYGDMFKVANDYSKEDTISIIANADIEFTKDACNKIAAIDYTNRCLALTRYTGNRLEASNGLTQDAWIFKGEIKKVEADFYLGIPRCDHVIATALHKAGYELINPCIDIKILHHHAIEERSYSNKDSVPGTGTAVKPCSIKSYLKKRLLLVQTGKVGDILICLPIAKKYASKYIVEWLCPEQYHSTFRNIDYCQPVTVKTGAYDKILDLNFGHGGSPERWWQLNKKRFNSFVEAKYELAQVDISERWNLAWNRNEKREDELLSAFGGDFALCHTQSNHVNITPETELKRVLFIPVNDYNIFDWYKVILEAKEIHCIDSSLANFIEVIKEIEHTPKFIYEGNNGGGVMMSIYKNNWNVYEEAVK